MPIALALVLGLLFGSFLNVVIHRLPRGMSLWRPRSRCPHCGRTIRAFDNVPLLSFLWLRGRCRSCQRSIALRYPLVELLGATCLGLAAAASADLAGFAARSAFLLAMIAVAFIDLDHRIIPDRITLPGIPVGVLLAPLVGVSRLDAVLGVIVGAGCLWLLGAAYRAVRGADGLGGGDVKLAGMMGAFLGWPGVILVLLLGSFLGSVVGGALLHAGRAHARTALPYGTFLAPAACVSCLWGAAIVGWYRSL